VEKHYDIISLLLADHVLSGCDTVAAWYGVGKRKCLIVFLHMIGNIQAVWSDVKAQTTKFKDKCYES